MEIKATGKMDYQTVKAFVHASSYGKTKPKKYLNFINISFAICAFLMTLIIIMGGGDSDAVLVVILDAVAIGLNYFLYYGFPKLQFKFLQKMQNIEQKYTFYDDFMTAICDEENFRGQTELKYTVIPKVIETSKYFFVFQASNQAYLVDKSTIENGTAEEIREKLSSFVPKKKYIICKY